MSDSSINILYVITDLEVGGVPLHLHRLVKAVRERGFNASVVSLAPPGPVSQTLQSEGVAVYSCHGRGGWDFRVLKRLARLIGEIQPDIIHSFLFHANVATRWAARRARFPGDRVVCEIQTVEVERRRHLWIDRWSHRGCRFTIGNSPSVINHLATRAGIPSDRLRLVRGGVDPERYRDVQAVDRSTLGVPEEAAMILWVGRFDPVKGLDFLIDAFQAVTQDARSAVRAKVDFHLVLTGDGPCRVPLLKRVKSMSLDDHVHCLGSRSDVPSLLKTADLFVLPSRTEGLPNALLEAMAAGCSIITTDVPGCHDLIDNETNGLLVPYGDTTALAQAIERMLMDRALAGRLADRARSTVSEHWHINQMFQSYVEIYHEMMSAHESLQES